MPSLGEAPNGGAKALWLLWRFSKVTRCKSETASRRYRRNGYAAQSQSLYPVVQSCNSPIPITPLVKNKPFKTNNLN
jgi:hypothetical protein